jgi:signal transduction histidine kinase
VSKLSFPELSQSVAPLREQGPPAVAGESSTIADWMIGSMSSGIIAIDRNGLLAMLNRGAQKILGCQEPDRCLGKPCREVLAAQPGVAALLLDALAGRAALSRAELVLEGVEERLASTIGFTLTPILDASGEVRGAAMIFRDLTPFERMDEQQRLAERLVALGQMAAGLAHEIRNPLAGMEVIASLLKRRLADRHDERQLLEQLTGELGKLAETVNECLEYVRPMAPERSLTDLIGLVEEGLATGLSRFEFDGSIERAFDVELDEVDADACQLRAVVTNLVVNAIEAMAGDNQGREKRLRLGVAEVARPAPVCPEGPSRDEVSTVDPGSPREIVITVSDTGPGVPDELRERIFYPFFTTKPTGSGVGLATAQKIATSHGGALELAPDRGQGATFRLRLYVYAQKNHEDPREVARPC